ncbi:multicopper oxidase domain-containing protein [Kineosporia sp. A_224]|uniref:multicopper oxidase domain-containing protein n=1 Tax=Kineosporia sp. A_224 TaxID=1962180 RepID=UPI000B4B9948|nr:multicopper oxidase domain-containing protein [Kineosporia sp. A_224]
MRTTPRYRRALAGLVGTTLALTVPVWAASAASAAVGGCAGTADTALDLWTASGSVALTATTTPVTATVWGYSTTGNVTDLTAPGGPVLTVTKGKSVQVMLHNGLTVRSSLSLPQMDGFTDDADGAPAGGTQTYCFTADRAGTYLYQAGATATGARQVAMGMAGILVVRPAAGDVATSIDGTSATAYATEAPLLLQEIDPALNANPTGFDMRLYAPKYRLINGRTFPTRTATDHVAATAGTTLALRLVNAGIVEHSLGALGLRQSVVALGSHVQAHPEDLFAETLQPGGTLDALVAIPAVSPSAPSSYVLYETAAGNGVSSLQSFSGMATTIDVAPAAVDPNAPVVSALVASPTSVTAGTDVQVTGQVTAGTPEWQLDGVGAWTSAAQLPFTVPTTGLAAGAHTVYVRAVDGALTGAAATVGFTIQATGAGADTTGPLVTGTTATPAKVKGGQTVTVTATGDDRTTGGSNVVSATVSLDGGATAPMTLNRTDNPVAALTATVSSAAGGHHTVAVRASDGVTPGNTSTTPGTATFDVDATLPTVGTVVVSPAANNGTLESRVGAGVFSVSAVVTDATADGVGGSIGYGEAFIDNSAGAVGTGFPMVPGTGVDPASASQAAGGVTVVADIPLSQVTGLANGPHTISVRGRDGVGNWSAATASGTFFVDKVAPTVASLTAGANRGSVNLPISGTLADTAPSSGFTGNAFVEAWVGTDPGAGNGTRLALTGTSYSGTLAVTVPASGTSSVTVNVRARDTAGNLSAVRTLTTPVTANQVFSNGFESANGNFGWSGRTGTTVFTRITSSSRITGTASGAVALGGTAAGYVNDSTPAAEVGYHASFDLRSLPTGTSATVFPVFRASSTTSATGTEVFRLEYQHAAVGGSRLRLVAAGASATPWLPVTDGAVTAVQVDWTRAGAAIKVGALTHSVTFATASAASVETVALGRTTATGTGLTGSLVLDRFVSARDHLPLP